MNYNISNVFINLGIFFINIYMKFWFVNNGCYKCLFVWWCMILYIYSSSYIRLYNFFYILIVIWIFYILYLV